MIFDQPEGQETFLGYVMNRNGGHPPPTRLALDEIIVPFVSAHVMTCYEIRITDTLDNCVMQIIEQELVFPVPEVGKGKRNKWSVRHQKFIVQEGAPATSA